MYFGQSSGTATAPQVFSKKVRGPASPIIA
jgi:hypothetical protein